MASRYERVTDFSDAEATNTAGRSEVSTANLDAELDSARAVINDHADDLDSIIRSDQYLVDGLLQGHEFSAAALAYLTGQVGSGATGPQGPQGEQGPAGADGTSFTVKGTVANAAALPGSASEGDAYVTLDDGHIHVWVTSAFVDLGAFLGPQGETGPAGETYPTQTGNADKVLHTDASDVSWQKVTSDMVDSTVAPTADTPLTGATTAENITVSGQFSASGPTQLGDTVDDEVYIVGYQRSSVTNYGTLTSTFTPIFNKSLMQVAQVGTDDIDLVYGSSVVGQAIEILITSHATADRAITETNGWTWLGYKPTSFIAGKKGILSLRSYGSTAADVVAAWTES